MRIPGLTLFEHEDDRLRYCLNWVHHGCVANGSPFMQLLTEIDHGIELYSENIKRLLHTYPRPTPSRSVYEYATLRRSSSQAPSIQHPAQTLPPLRSSPSSSRHASCILKDATAAVVSAEIPPSSPISQPPRLQGLTVENAVVVYATGPRQTIPSPHGTPESSSPETIITKGKDEWDIHENDSRNPGETLQESGAGLERREM